MVRKPEDAYIKAARSEPRTRSGPPRTKSIRWRSPLRSGPRVSPQREQRRRRADDRPVLAKVLTPVPIGRRRYATLAVDADQGLVALALLILSLGVAWRSVGLGLGEMFSGSGLRLLRTAPRWLALRSVIWRACQRARCPLLGAATHGAHGHHGVVVALSPLRVSPGTPGLSRDDRPSGVPVRLPRRRRGGRERSLAVVRRPS